MDAPVASVEELAAALTRQSPQPYAKLSGVLLREGLITEAQLRAALALQVQQPGLRMEDVLLRQGVISAMDLNRAIAIQVGVPRVDLRRFKASVDALRLVPEKLATSLKAMPLCVLNSSLVVAVANPMDPAPLEQLRFHTGMTLEPVLAPEEEVLWAIERYYSGNIDLLASILDDSQSEADDLGYELSESDNALVKFVNRMILDAYEQRASDIHIEPYSGRRKSLIRFRKDGTLVNYAELPFHYRNAIVARVKVMCGLDIAERRKPQDGKIDFSKFGPAKLELRVVTVPTAGGMEDVVMRLLAGSERLPLDDLLLTPSNLENIKQLIAKPYGLFLVCGPTGSGKTTTLHSVLGHLNTPGRKIWTAEDPVEITQDGLRQVQVNQKIGITFAGCMRTFLRADPDIIMVGEMRDEETASVAIEASLTGHLVFSTLHTNSAPESVVRLLDMGMNASISPTRCWGCWPSGWPSAYVPLARRGTWWNTRRWGLCSASTRRKPCRPTCIRTRSR
ncbi:GspE/PulE family protein [Methylogaea oryzae]|uniref:GspE/PulE family protein n=1 Tax=Methylogaea oryzae TaxID=1295382 RepID=UPI0006D13D69|nr:ATPase, T2SS/T4P/T4SS family [Methylogaea oryzae]